MTKPNPIQHGQGYLLYPCLEGWCMRRVQITGESREEIITKRVFSEVDDALGAILDMETPDIEPSVPIEIKNDENDE